MDGARFANALVSLDATPAEMTWKSGIDVLSFGATKNGCLAAEAIIFFKKDLVGNHCFFNEKSRAFTIKNAICFCSIRCLYFK